MTVGRQLNFSVLPRLFSVVRLAPDAAIPFWATEAPFFSITRTPEELSIVAEEFLVPAGVTSEPGWSVLKLAGPIPFAETGVLSAVLAPLASANISIFSISTFDTDYLLVRSTSLQEAIAALEQSGHKIHRSSEE
ncbi:MAG TPA: ACT domain-containing protein [Candidatus Saccharimonadales bacterium]|nr:ACT domain-containing protein [Candidatus Saccharimonadales bacterium]